MNASAFGWIHQQAARHRLAGARVLDVGSYDVNGTLRPIFEEAYPAKEYVGLDQREGPGVDVVVDVENIHSLYRCELAGRFDVVVSTEMLEHTPHPWRAVAHMAECLVAGGRILLTTRAPGFGIHEHPGDFYRFTRAAIAVLLDDAGFVDVETFDDPDEGSPGVFATGVRA